MAVVSVKPEITNAPLANLPQIEPTPLKSIISTNDTYQSALPMLLFVDGSQYTVNYYSQVLGLNTDLRELDSGQSGVYQQYSKINNLELRVTTELTSSFNAATNMTVVSGTANVYPPLVPNVNDMFVGNIGDGKDAIFVVKAANRVNFSRDSVYVIDYELSVDITSGSGISRYVDLESKVINTTYFYKDFLLGDRNPNLISADYKAVVDLGVVTKDMISYFYKTFFNQDHNTLVVPDQSSLVYDSRLAELMMCITTTTDAAQYRRVRLLNMDDDFHLRDDCIWTAMLAKDTNLIDYTNNRSTLVSAAAFNNNPILEGYRYSGIPYAVYPIVSTPVIKVTKPTNAAYQLIPSPVNSGGVGGTISNAYTTVSGTIPFIKPVLVDDYYVLSADFYLKTTNQSLLEVVVSDYLANRATPPAIMITLAGQFRKWNRLEQFYYIPLLIILCNNVVNSI